MNITDHLSSSLGERTQLPNKALAQEIVRTQNREALNQLIKLLSANPKTDLLADAIKVLEVMGELDSSFTSSAFLSIVPHLSHPANKIQWRAMSALSTIAQHHQGKTFEMLPTILDLMDAGTVVTRDHGFKILITFYQEKSYQETIYPLITDQILRAPDNQLGQYTEKWMNVINPKHRPQLITVLESRQGDLTNPSHQKRIARVLLKLHKMKN